MCIFCMSTSQLMRLKFKRRMDISLIYYFTFSCYDDYDKAQATNIIVGNLYWTRLALISTLTLNLFRSKLTQEVSNYEWHLHYVNRKNFNALIIRSWHIKLFWNTERHTICYTYNTVRCYIEWMNRCTYPRCISWWPVK